MTEIELTVIEQIAEIATSACGYNQQCGVCFPSPLPITSVYPSQMLLDIKHMCIKP